jgi:hypothetical protein
MKKILLILGIIGLLVLVYCIFIRKKDNKEVSLPKVSTSSTGGCASTRMAAPPAGKQYICIDDSWQLVDIVKPIGS